MIVVAATTHIAPETRSTFVALALETIAETRKEDGCVSYTCAADIADPDAFHWIEVWRDVDAFTAHRDAPHHRAFMAALKDQGEVRRLPGPSGHFYEAVELKSLRLTTEVAPGSA